MNWRIVKAGASALPNSRYLRVAQAVCVAILLCLLGVEGSVEGQVAGTAPQGLTCHLLPGRHVQLSWANAGHYSSLSILRDGVAIAAPAPDDLYFIDTGPTVGEHSYKVEANGDPSLDSASCEVKVLALPVDDLSCQQIGGTTKVHLTWKPGDDYEHLTVSLNGKVIRDDLPGFTRSFEMDPGPGTFQFEVFDSEEAQDSIRATCSIDVVPFKGSQVAGLACQVRSRGPNRIVSLKWSPNNEYDHFKVIRDDTVLAVVKGVTYDDDEPHSGTRVYQVVGLTGDLHASAPATCSVVIPGKGGTIVRGRVTFADPPRTPIGGGRAKVYNSAGTQLGSAQPGEQGEFEIPIAGGTPASVVFEVTLPALDDRDPVPSHGLRVEAPAALGTEVELSVPVPVVAFSGLLQGAERWTDLIRDLEGLRGPDGRLRGILTFAFEGKAEIARAAKGIDESIREVTAHLRTYLAAEPSQVDLIAHGFSGLAARVYLEGLAPGVPRTRTLILLGTPNRGSVLAGLDALAAAPDRFSLVGPEGREEDQFTAAGQQSPQYLEEFNRRISDVHGTVVHLVAGVGGSAALQAVLGCPENDGRVCQDSALGVVPGIAHTVGDVHQALGQSAASIDLIGRILLDPLSAGDAGVPAGGAGGGSLFSSFEAGSTSSSILTQTTTELPLYSDTTGSVIIIFNSMLPGSIDFKVETPGGATIDPAHANPAAGVAYQAFTDGEGHQIQSYSFDPGEVGTYTAVIANDTPSLRVPYSVQIYLDSDLALAGNLSSGDVSAGEETRVTASLAMNGVPVPGATAEARISLPDGGFVVLPLQDDGQGPDLAPGDGTYSASYSAPAVAGLYSLTLRASGGEPFPFLREETITLLVRSSAASFQEDFSSGSMDSQADGVLDDLWVDGGIQASEAGVYIVIGKLTNVGGNPVTSSGAMLGMQAPGNSAFRLYFSGQEIADSGYPGPYVLSDLSILDGNRGLLLCERRSDVLTTSPYTLTQFGASTEPRFIRGDSNADGRVDMSDTVALLWSMFSGGPNLPCLDAADSNADLVIDLSDAVAILEVLFQTRSSLPAPFPACGSVPALRCEDSSACR
jgi:hypothetical protein